VMSMIFRVSELPTLETMVLVTFPPIIPLSQRSQGVDQLPQRIEVQVTNTIMMKAPLNSAAFT